MNERRLLDFLARLAEIESYWSYLSGAARLTHLSASPASGEVLAHLQPMNAALTPGLRKSFDYASIVIALYGAIEDYVERLVEHYAKVISQCSTSYSALPASLKKNHERLSLKLADSISQKGYRGISTLEDVVGNLYRCLMDDRPFRLNLQAFSIHSANIRRDVVRDLFNSVGIVNIDKAIEVNTHTADLMFDLGRSSADWHFYINDLADRRNTIAHGERPYDIISTQMMGEYFRAVRVFGHALFECALVGLFDAAGPVNAVRLGAPTATYKSGKVVCVQPDVPVKLAAGERLLWRTGTGWRLARIVSLQVDRCDHAEIDSQPGTMVGIGISSSGSDTAEYWVLS